MSEQSSEFGIVGLTAAGQALALRLCARGFRVSLWDESFDTLHQFAEAHFDTRGGLVAFESLEDFFDSLTLPARAACFLPAESGVARRASEWAGEGLVQAAALAEPAIWNAASATATAQDAILDAIEARLLAPPE